MNVPSAGALQRHDSLIIHYVRLLKLIMLIQLEKNKKQIESTHNRRKRSPGELEGVNPNERR